MDNIIALVFFVMTIVAIVHYFFQSVVLPTLRMAARYDLFELRDRLRKIKATNSQLSNEVYNIVDQNISNSIAISPQYDLGQLIKFKQAVKANPKLIKHAEALRNKVENCPIQEVKEISYASSRILTKTLFKNSAMLILYLSPILLVLIFWLVLTSFYEVLIKKKIESFITIIKTSVGFRLMRESTSDLAYSKKWVVEHSYRKPIVKKKSSPIVFNHEPTSEVYY